jgi:hypothetical protein
MKNARAVTGPGVDVAIGVSLYLRFAGESRPASTDSNAWVDFPLFARVVVRLFVTLFRLRGLLGRKLITCFYDVNHFAEIFSARFSAAPDARAGGVADMNSRARIASPRGRRKPRKTRGLRKVHARTRRATTSHASSRSGHPSSSRRHRAGAVDGRARRVDLAKVRGFFSGRRRRARRRGGRDGEKKPASASARVGVAGRSTRQAASADSSAVANASMSAADFVSVVHSSSTSSMPA